MDVEFYANPPSFAQVQLNSRQEHLEPKQTEVIATECQERYVPSGVNSCQVGLASAPLPSAASTLASSALITMAASASARVL